MKLAKLKAYAIYVMLGAAVGFGSNRACDHVHNKRHDQSEIVKSTAHMYSEPINNSQDGQIRVVFRVTPEYKPVAEALLHDDTVIGFEAPRWIYGVTGGKMEVYNPEIHKIVRPEELEKMRIGEEGEILKYVSDDTRKIEIISPRQNKAFRLRVRLNRRTGLYHKEWDITAYRANGKASGGGSSNEVEITEDTFPGQKIYLEKPGWNDTAYCEVDGRFDAPESRSLVPWIGGIGEQHNQFLSESEQKRFGTYSYVENQKKRDEILEQVWQEYYNSEKYKKRLEASKKPGLSDVEISLLRDGISLEDLAWVYNEADKRLGPEIAKRAKTDPIWLKPYISLLDHSESYVSFLKGNYFRLFNSPNWKSVAEESLRDIRSGNIIIRGDGYMTIAKVTNNSSTLDKIDITLYGRWPKLK